MAKPEKPSTDNELVMVSFRLEKDLKEQVAVAARMHGRTISKQFAQSLEDGLKLQDCISEVNEHLTETITHKDKEYVYKPSEDECLGFIIDATRYVIDKMKRERGEK